MNISSILAIDEEDCLLSVQYIGQRLDEFNRLFELWNDATFLDNFFTENIKLLNSPAARRIWPSMTIENAVELTRRDALGMEEHFLELADSGQFSKENLSTFFEPLSKPDTYEIKFGRNKAKGLSENSWLRIYAIRIESNKFVVSGGCIKLTDVMPDEEIIKLRVTKKYLKKNPLD
jgi:hypothetical protein